MRAPITQCLTKSAITKHFKLVCLLCDCFPGRRSVWRDGDQPSCERHGAVGSVRALEPGRADRSSRRAADKGGDALQPGATVGGHQRHRRGVGSPQPRLRDGSYAAKGATPPWELANRAHAEERPVAVGGAQTCHRRASCTSATAGGASRRGGLRRADRRSLPSSCHRPRRGGFRSGREPPRAHVIRADLRHRLAVLDRRRGSSRFGHRCHLVGRRTVQRRDGCGDGDDA